MEAAGHVSNAWWGDRDTAELRRVADMTALMTPDQLTEFLAALDPEDLAMYHQAAGMTAVATPRPVENPLDELARLAAQAVAWKDEMADTIERLKDQYRWADEKQARMLDRRVAQLERAMDRCSELLVDWVKLGFDERRLAMTNEQGRQIVAVIRTITDGLLQGLLDAGLDRATAERVFRDQLPGLARRALEAVRPAE